MTFDADVLLDFHRDAMPLQNAVLKEVAVEMEMLHNASLGC